jgi:hypothetical protein
MRFDGYTHGQQRKGPERRAFPEPAISRETIERVAAAKRKADGREASIELHSDRLLYSDERAQICGAMEPEHLDSSLPSVEERPFRAAEERELRSGSARLIKLIPA